MLRRTLLKGALGLFGMVALPKRLPGEIARPPIPEERVWFWWTAKDGVIVDKSAGHVMSYEYGIHQGENGFKEEEIIVTAAKTNNAITHVWRRT